MQAVNIAELKNNLSAYLKRVRAGEEIVVRDRNSPIARIIPWVQGEDDELVPLATEGKLRLGTGYIDDNFWDLPAPHLSRRALKDALLAEREDA